jgi:predicted ATPase
MLKRLRFKNWRSLRDVTIENLTPLTVFIGANSSGKTNILDALRFIQYADSPGNRGVIGAIRYKWGGRENIQTIGVQDESTEIEFSFVRSNLEEKPSLITDLLGFKFYDTASPLIRLHSKVTLGDEVIEEYENDLPSMPRSDGVFWGGQDNEFPLIVRTYIHTFTSRRWQFFKELFVPQLTVARQGDPDDLYVVEESGRNIVYMLDFMRDHRPDLYQNLVEDLAFLLSHVQQVDVKQIRQELAVAVRETTYPDLDAPSISAGTARLIAILTAYYALDMEIAKLGNGTTFPEWNVPIAQMPGLLIIEEPDTALNPGILAKFVGQLRSYANHTYPRQFILTTHNPSFLNYFEPAEVQVVTRDEAGDTHVERVPESVREIWLDEHGLGEVWTTNSFGGLPR